MVSHQDFERVSRQVRLNRGRTTISLERIYWQELEDIAHLSGWPMRRLLIAIERECQNALSNEGKKGRFNFSSALRVWFFDYRRR
ncbi:hypothetical protein D3093_33420 (plasmid) [Azospirillum argentinense]|uniref:Ribbon-helix-helix domain-containing protein n=1 Tax=Azospirillum argentinense TaxID=2970906 RepID=A0A4D8PXJ4_9PROT|nr:hypothetical protein D3093_33420 [Azospirillum argentinense]